ncbi:MAG: hypothetical protein AB1465_02600 [Patescibacteria group bacterium]
MSQKHKKNLLVKLGLLFGVIILLTALGCKKSTPESTQTTESPAESPAITYPTNERLTNEATTEETVSPSPATSTPTSTAAETPSPAASPTAATTPTSPTSEVKTTDEDLTLKQQAEKLAEIYGTYTNKDKEPYKNFKELKPYATTKMQAWLDTQTKKSPEESDAPFYGVTTKALSSAVIESSADAKKILVTVKQEEITSTRATPQVSYKILLLNFKKEKEEWKLDGVYWQ